MRNVLYFFFSIFHLTSSPYYRIHTIPSITSINRFVLSYILQSAFLEVVIPPDIISEETSNDLMVPEGGSAKLVCKARGYPKPEIVWKREDGAEIISRAGLSGGKTKCEYNYTYYHIIIRSCSIFMLCDILILRIILNKFARLSDILQWRLSWMEICKILFESITIFWENNLKKSLLLVVWSDEREIPSFGDFQNKK